MLMQYFGCRFTNSMIEASLIPVQPLKSATF